MAARWPTGDEWMVSVGFTQDGRPRHRNHGALHGEGDPVALLSPEAPSSGVRPGCAQQVDKQTFSTISELLPSNTKLTFRREEEKSLEPHDKPWGINEGSLVYRIK